MILPKSTPADQMYQSDASNFMVKNYFCHCLKFELVNQEYQRIQCLGFFYWQELLKSSGLFFNKILYVKIYTSRGPQFEVFGAQL